MARNHGWAAAAAAYRSLYAQLRPTLPAVKSTLWAVS
jgi:hypothetical protein